MHIFDQDLSYEKKDLKTFTFRISDNWGINSVPNGGYLTAICTKPMLDESDKIKTPILTTNYLSRCEPGEAEVKIEKISESTQFTRYTGSLFQNGKERIRVMATFAGEGTECAVERYERKPPVVAEKEKCIGIPKMPGYTLFRHLDIRLDPQSAGWMKGELAEISEHKGFAKFMDERNYDTPSICLIADAFPPAVLSSQGMTPWVPTIEMSVNLRNPPVSKWLKCLFRTRFITCGLLEEDGEIWDESDNLVAISRQIAQYRKG